jgi:AcrR family transcriptional regulator
VLDTDTTVHLGFAATVTGGDPEQYDRGRDVREVERARIVAGITKAVIERGHARLTLEQILRYAGVSADTFHSHFASTEGGILAAQDAFLDRLWLEVTAACDPELEWIENLRASIAAGLAYISEASALARVFAVEAAASSLAISERQFATMDAFAGLLRRGRERHPLAAELPEVTERVLVGGIASIVTSHLLSEDPRALEGLEPQLAELVLVYDLGRDEARRISGAAGEVQEGSGSTSKRR